MDKWINKGHLSLTNKNPKKEIYNNKLQAKIYIVVLKLNTLITVFSSTKEPLWIYNTNAQIPIVILWLLVSIVKSIDN